jgi:hypothetical protein
LVRTTVPDPVKRNLFDVALWVFNLVFCFRCTVKLLSTDYYGLLAQPQ